LKATLNASQATLKFGGGYYERRRRELANVYVEARPKGLLEGSDIKGFVVEDHADNVLATFKTQKEAVDWARKNGHSPLVARVRHLNDKAIPEHWRSA
jgi:hypothetical protein